MLIRKRGSTAATIAVLLGGIGAFCGAIVNVFVGINLAAAASAHVTHDAAARFLVTNFNSGPGQAFTDVYAFSEFVAPIIMGVALWRSRRVPRWLAVLFAVGFELAEQTASVGIAKVVLQMAPFALAMVLLSVRIWRAADQVAPVSDDHEPTLVNGLMWERTTMDEMALLRHAGAEFGRRLADITPDQLIAADTVCGMDGA